jgi:hypothetical protein
MRFKFLALTVLSALFLTGAVHAQTLYNDPTKNIFDTYDPLCDGTDASIKFCDGFEDGKWIDTSVATACDTGITPKVENDYWVYSYADQWDWMGGKACEESFDFDFVHCNSNRPVNSGIANYGAAGTDCAGSQGWSGEDRDTYYTKTGQSYGHALSTSRVIFPDSGDPSAWDATDGTMHFSYRFYFRQVGVESLICDCQDHGGYDCDRTTLPTPACPAWVTNSSNGFKAVEFKEDDFTVGVQIPLATWSSTDTGDEDSQFKINTNAACSDSGSVSPARFLAPDSGPGFNHFDYVGNWIFMEFEYKNATSASSNDGFTRAWMDDCGADGLSCTGTPTLAHEWENLDNFSDGTGDSGRCPAASSGGVNTIWNNWWSGGISANTNYKGEIQIDEIVFRDREVTDENIGFAPLLSSMAEEGSLSGSTVSGGSVR